VSLPRVNNAWAKEARVFPPDPITGTGIVRLSGSSIRTENIYCDAPRASGDGNRLASWRYIDKLLSPAKALLCHDLPTKWTCLIDGEVTGLPVGPAWGGSVYYLSGNVLKRASLDTCTAEPLMTMEGLPRCWQFMSVSPDERYLLYVATEESSEETPFTVNTASSSKEYNLIRLNLRDKTWKALSERPETSRMGGSYNPVTGAEILIGTSLWEGDTRVGVGWLSDAEGRNGCEVFRRVHHACWLGNTGTFAALGEYDFARFRHLPENPDGELYIYSADGTPPRLIPVPEYLFYHISSSPCGRYVVCESLSGGLDLGPVPIVVVNVQTGNHRVLISDAHCSHGGDSGRQVNAYFTADLRHVIYNADPDGVVNVFAAEIPQGFLESLA